MPLEISNLPPEKQCTKCQQTKPASEFSLRRGRGSGRDKFYLVSRCKDCKRRYNKEANRKWRKEHPARAKATGRRWAIANPDYPAQYREANKERLAAKNKAYRKANRDKINEKHREYMAAHPEKRREQARRYRARHPEKVKAAHNAWRAKNRDRINAENRQRRADHPGVREKRKERCKQWHKGNKDKVAAYYKANRERILERRRLYRETNREKLREQARQYRKENPKIKANQKKRRRARKAGALGSHTLAEFQALCDLYGNVCIACGEDGKLTEDHVIPLVRGGSDYIENIQPLCHRCNSAKQTKCTDYRRDSYPASPPQMRLFDIDYVLSQRIVKQTR